MSKQISLEDLRNAALESYPDQDAVLLYRENGPGSGDGLLDLIISELESVFDPEADLASAIDDIIPALNLLSNDLNVTAETLQDKLEGMLD